jgi:hypothetical protein
MLVWVLTLHCISCSVIQQRDYRGSRYDTEADCVKMGEIITADFHQRKTDTFEYSCRQEGIRGPGKRRP